MVFNIRSCMICGGIIPRHKQAHAKYCCKACYIVARDKGGIGNRRKTRWGHTMANIIPDHVYAERYLAVNAPRTLTAILCGDPLPGRSALDKETKLNGKVDKIPTLLSF